MNMIRKEDMKVLQSEEGGRIKNGFHFLSCIPFSVSQIFDSKYGTLINRTWGVVEETKGEEDPSGPYCTWYLVVSRCPPSCGLRTPASTQAFGCTPHAFSLSLKVCEALGWLSYLGTREENTDFWRRKTIADFFLKPSWPLLRPTNSFAAE